VHTAKAGLGRSTGARSLWKCCVLGPRPP
jgi:hypothetical protein